MQATDILVVGLGAMGSAALYQCSRQSRCHVVGIDQYQPPHDLGSSFGGSRLIRISSAEGPEYTGIAKRSLELIQALQQTTQKQLYYSGGIIIADQDNPFFQKTIAIAKENHLQYQLLDEAELTQRYPQMQNLKNARGYTEENIGTLVPEAIIKTQLELAQQNGAVINDNEAFERIEQYHDAIIVHTDKASYQCQHVVMSTGAWMQDHMAQSALPKLEVHRALQLWYRPKDLDLYQPKNFPATGRLFDGNYASLLFPHVEQNGLIKLATWTLVADPKDAVTATTINRKVSEQEKFAAYEKFIAPYFVDIEPECVEAKVCLYTVAPSYQFHIDYHPDFKRRVMLVNACSGHGFKHSAAIGEAIAQDIFKGQSKINLLQSFAYL